MTRRRGALSPTSANELSRSVSSSRMARTCPASRLLLQLLDALGCLGFGEGRVEWLVGFGTEGLQIRALRAGHGLIARRPVVRILHRIVMRISNAAVRTAARVDATPGLLLQLVDPLCRLRLGQRFIHRLVCFFTQCLEIGALGTCHVLVARDPVFR